jgi:hypothetical protein
MKNGSEKISILSACPLILSTAGPERMRTPQNDSGIFEKVGECLTGIHQTVFIMLALR